MNMMTLNMIMIMVTIIPIIIIHMVLVAPLCTTVCKPMPRGVRLAATHNNQHRKHHSGAYHSQQRTQAAHTAHRQRTFEHCHELVSDLRPAPSVQRLGTDLQHQPVSTQQGSAAHEHTGSSSSST